MYDESQDVYPDSQSETESAGIDTSTLQAVFRNQLLACLEECARGRIGLFANHEIAGENAWPQAARLRELAFALQSILAQESIVNPLIEHFLDLCTMHGESNPGEPKLARAFLDHIAAENL